jgi:hypothetical protein
VAPPAGGWISTLLDDLQTTRFGAPAAVPRFDGRPHRYDFRAPRDGDFAWSHAELRPELLGLMRELGLDVRSPGVFAGRRQALLELGAAWTVFSTEEAFWVDLLNEGVRRGVASLTDGGGFTFAPQHEPDPRQDEEAALFDAYLLRHRWMSWTAQIARAREEREEAEPA